jgi:uncharacterized protein (DUF488 family)
VALLTVGHGTASQEELAALLTGARIRSVVDVRTAPGSRRHPHVGRARLAAWLPEAGIAYRWEPDLGGWRRPRPDSPNVALRHEGFRGYADYMGSPPFWTALDRVLAEAGDDAGGRTAVMCSESLWWRCHRRLLADAAVLARSADVLHLGHDGSLAPHRVTDGARLAGPDLVVYDNVAGVGAPSSCR